MSTTTSATDQSTSSNQSPRKRPEGFHTVTPHLVCGDTSAAIEFYKRAFGAEEMIRVPAPNGKLIHACMRIGDSPVMLVDEFPDMGSFSPKSLKGTPVTIHLYVDDVDAFSRRAVAAGAKVVMPVADMFWGDRYGLLEDPFGHQWSVATTVHAVSPEDLPRLAMENCTPAAGSKTARESSS